MFLLHSMGEAVAEDLSDFGSQLPEVHGLTEASLEQNSSSDVSLEGQSFEERHSKI